MRITRFILPGVVLGWFAAPVGAQFPDDPGSRYPLIPSVRPIGADEPEIPRTQLPPLPPMPSGRPPAAVSSLEQMTAPQPGAASAADPVGTLTGQPAQVPPNPYPSLPPGSYPSPYYVDGPGCCSPMGRDGRIGYEVYTFSGANIVFGPGLPTFLNTGWSIGGGVNSLFFDPTHTSAWTIDLGASYTHNWGTGSHKPVTLQLRNPPTQNQTTGVITVQPDITALSAIDGVHRESFNFNLGHDWWLWGAGNTGGERGTNVRVGGWVGGRYGSAHVDIIPLDQVDGYSRRQNAFEGFVVGAHITFEKPMGGWILFGGLRAEYGYDWLNLVPPVMSDIQNVNLQVSLGIRF